MPNLEFVSLAILEVLAFNDQKIRRHVTLAAPPFEIFFKETCRDFSWEHA